MSLHTRNFLIALAATVIWFFIMRPFTPPNIVEFELAGSVETASKIMSAWSVEQAECVTTSIYLDFGFIVVYCSAFMFACRAAGNYSGVPFFIKIGKQLAGIVWIAGVCDAIENLAMLQTLHDASQSSVSVAFYFAIIKFGILLIALIFVLIGLITGIFTSAKT